MTEATEATETAACDFAAMAAPTEAHEKLNAFEGTFRAEVKVWMGPGDPIVSTGSMVNELDLGGRFLKQTYTGDPNEGPFGAFEGRGYFGFNKTTNQYEGFWIDSASTLMQNETGDVDDAGKIWTMTSTMPCPQTGGTMQKRSVITLIDNDHHSLEMFFTGPDGNEAKGMQIQYTRA